MNNGRYYGAAIAAFSIWGFLPLMLKILGTFSPGEILYFRILFSCVILAVVLIFRIHKIKEDWQRLKDYTKAQRNSIILLTLGGGALLTINWLVFIYTVNEVNIRTASFSYLICPVMTAALGYLLLNEKMTAMQWGALGLCMVSCILMGINSVTELGYSVVIAFTYALYLVSQRKNREFDRMVVLAVQILFSFLLLNIFFSRLINEIPGTERFYLIIIIVAGVFTILPLFLNLFALMKINSATVGILMYINPIINFIIAFIVFDESPSMLQWVGYSIILGALILFNYPNFKKLRSVVVA